MKNLLKIYTILLIASCTQILKVPEGIEITKACAAYGLEDMSANTQNIPLLAEMLRQNKIASAFIAFWYDDHVNFVLHNEGSFNPLGENNLPSYAFCQPSLSTNASFEDKHNNVANNLKENYFGADMNPSTLTFLEKFFADDPQDNQENETNNPEVTKQYTPGNFPLPSGNTTLYNNKANFEAFEDSKNLLNTRNEQNTPIYTTEIENKFIILRDLQKNNKNQILKIQGGFGCSKSL